MDVYCQAENCILNLPPRISHLPRHSQHHNTGRSIMMFPIWARSLNIYIQPIIIILLVLSASSPSCQQQQYLRQHQYVWGAPYRTATGLTTHPPTLCIIIIIFRTANYVSRRCRTATMQPCSVYMATSPPMPMRATASVSSVGVEPVAWHHRDHVNEPKHARMFAFTVV